uniref:RNase H type-1 domain-containing protein n=1 Tax=Chenopodium quinoa TaxID=63459 RepID=A0A803N9H4_CHEQI
MKMSQVEATSSRSNPSPRTWAPPPVGFYKINTDGSWIDINNDGAGGVLRCHKRKWQIGFSMRLNTVGPVSAVLLAIREGLSTAWERQIRFVQLEIDAKALKYMLENPTRYMDDKLAAIIGDISKLLAKEWVVNILHVKRTGNKIAHGLANLGRRLPEDSDTVYHFYSPSSLTEVYMKELTTSMDMLNVG